MKRYAIFMVMALLAVLCFAEPSTAINSRTGSGRLSAEFGVIPVIPFGLEIGADAELATLDLGGRPLALDASMRAAACTFEGYDGIWQLPKFINDYALRGSLGLTARLALGPIGLRAGIGFGANYQTWEATPLYLGVTALGGLDYSISRRTALGLEYGYYPEGGWGTVLLALRLNL